MHTYTNGGAGAAIPPAVIPTVVGAGLANRHLDKRQRACLAAGVIDGTVEFIPSQQQLAHIFGVSVPYIELARKLSPSKRTGILHGWDPTSFVDLVHPTRQLRLKLPAPNCASITNSYLETVIRAVGVERVIEAACAVEQHT
jgi:hypothetical protein